MMQDPTAPPIFPGIISIQQTRDGRWFTPLPQGGWERHYPDRTLYTYAIISGLMSDSDIPPDNPRVDLSQGHAQQFGSSQQRQQQQTSLQGQLQAEMNHQGLLKAQIDSIVPLKGQTDLNNNQQIQMQAALTALADSRAKVDSLNTALQQLAQTGTTAAATASASLQNLDAQRKSIHQASADMDALLKPDWIRTWFTPSPAVKGIYGSEDNAED